MVGVLGVLAVVGVLGVLAVVGVLGVLAVVGVLGVLAGVGVLWVLAGVGVLGVRPWERVPAPPTPCKPKGEQVPLGPRGILGALPAQSLGDTRASLYGGK